MPRQIIHLETPRTARVVRHAPATGLPNHWIVGLHGYGQLAAEFGESLAEGSPPEAVILAPEALSRYYVDHRRRQIGASWMTSEDREYDILDYVRYLDAVVEEEWGRWEETAADTDATPRLTVLGFSQGASTATRWIGNGAIRPNRLICWGAPPAHDLTDEAWDALSAVPSIIVISGSNDDYFSEDRTARAMELFHLHGCTAQLESFEGGHEIHLGLLSRILAFDG